MVPIGIDSIKVKYIECMVCIVVVVSVGNAASRLYENKKKPEPKETECVRMRNEIKWRSANDLNSIFI